MGIPVILGLMLGRCFVGGKDVNWFRREELIRRNGEAPEKDSMKEGQLWRVVTFLGWVTVG